ncbi:MAG: excinuclease ABC subunit UvrC [Actinomycetota bacterium]|nr:excinuclease ABC subunit UvrC [Actinomycetota bacterium]
MDKLPNSEIPNKPGIYIFKDRNEIPLYVGKAKNLRKRVGSYFNPNSPWKVKRLVSESKEVSFLISKSESDALLTEYSFIQEYRPKYNIQFKDDKSYPYISITNQDWARVLVTRNLNRDNLNFGPFAFVGSARKSLDHLINIYPVRTCNESVFKRHQKLEKPCLLYDIDKCCAPCVGLVSKEKYFSFIKEIEKFYTGHSDELISVREDLMKQQSSNQNYEDAAKTRDLIRHLESARESQILMSSDKHNVDVIAINIGKFDVIASCAMIRNGRVVGEKKIKIEPLEPSDIESYISELIVSIVSNEDSAELILLNHEVKNIKDIESIISKKNQNKTIIEFPKKGWKGEILNTLIIDAEEMRRVSNLKRRTDLEFRTLSLEQLMNYLSLPNIPYRIEGYDISNMGESNRVGSMVVMEDGLIKTSLNRIFHIKSFSGQDDFKSIEEVLFRRLKRLASNDSSSDISFDKTPDLILIDGGKGQLSSAIKVCSHLALEIPIISLAKKNEEVYLPNRKMPINLPEDSEALNILTTIRDEAHRFALSEHRRLRVKSLKKNDLLSIQGVGDKTLRVLFNEFGSLTKISKASYDELVIVVKPSIAEKVYEFFNARY